MFDIESANRNRSYQTVDSNGIAQQGQGLQEKLTDLAQKFFPDSKLFSFNAINVISCYIMYIICWLTYWFSDMSWRCTTHFYGSHYGPDVGQQYQFHRLLTPMILHQNNMHIFFNTLGLLFFGFQLENYYGFKRFLSVYLMAGIGGNLLSIYWHYENFSLGASTGVFGILAFQCIYLYERKEQLGPKFNRQISSLAFILIINIVQSMTSPQIDGASHFGGFAFGLLMGLLFINNEWINKRKWIRLLIIIILILSTFYLTAKIISYNDGRENPVPTFDQLEKMSFIMNRGEKNEEKVGYCSKQLENYMQKKQQEQENKTPFG
ncbi:hypothetical protein PPERSA_10585 [Pseudocohnilembus persalinus]|uniref:Peptidase S54 rhomboid domain-containing protein n=1 Tax=Pseudocohnilembus persalinus TaxID=266149 RepID=A0A0V0Q9C2_PSEPJ|nr:hypothetical protein PPERSA_10585 [Pseudocohnilembus persalinus]|eukprot:KRW98814.1 hypothetical protein PPERSA_10585 [Pseudocohnilembus persalinus]